jgi:hypothetical protein
MGFLIRYGAVLWNVAESRVSQRSHLATGHRHGIIRVRDAESGALIGERQASVYVSQVELRYTWSCPCATMAHRAFRGSRPDDTPLGRDGETVARRQAKGLRLATIKGRMVFGCTVARWEDGRLLLYVMG